MTVPTGKILKSSEVEVEGKCVLDFAGTAPSGPNQKNHTQTPGVPAKVRMIENQKDYAVMEITCPCGRKTIIRCDYGEKI
jgi:hypothetical protein